MSTIELTADNFSETTEHDGVVLVDWWAEWCGPCKRFAPIFEAAATAHPDVTFGKVDTEAEIELSARFGIQSFPTLMIMRDGVLLFSQAGALPAEALEDLIAQAKALDMDEVRRTAEESVERAS
jgi:thioredoxin 1